MTTWREIRERWSQGWRDLLERGIRRWRQAAAENPERFRAGVVEVVDQLAESRERLLRMKSSFPRPLPPAFEPAHALYSELLDRYQTLAAGIYTEAGLSQETVGIAPAVLVIGALSVSAVGIAWAMVARSYVNNLVESVRLAEAELAARVRASEEGRTLQPSTLPTPTSTTPGWLVPLLALGSGAAVVSAILAWRRA